MDLDCSEIAQRVPLAVDGDCTDAVEAINKDANAVTIMARFPAFEDPAATLKLSARVLDL